MRAVLTCILAVMFFVTLQCYAQNSSNVTPAKNAKSEKNTSLEACLISGNQEFYDRFKKTKLDFESTYVYKISNNKLKSFTLKEKIIYCIYFPETYNQICDIIEDHKAKFIYPYIDSDHFEHETSDRQLKILRDNRDSVIRYISLCFKSSESITNSEIWFLAQLNAYECMPDLLSLFSKNSNNEILTYCMLLMKKDKFEQFLKSKEYKGLYAKTSKSKELYYDDHQRHIRRTPEVVSNILALSNQYYKWKLERKQ